MTLPSARILGIESSCDETAAAVVTDGRVIQSSVVASQIDLHAQYGGVFPELASREHVKAIYAIVDQALQQAHLDIKDIDAIAVTRGPGLAGSLVVGVNMAKSLALAAQKPIIGVNHLEGHIYSAWLYLANTSPHQAPRFPLLALLVSGGHSELVLIKDHLQYQRLGGTLDDAAGEAFDKVARLLGLSYPGGPSIQKASHTGSASAFAFPRAMLEDTWDFSFSGVKTSVLRMTETLQEQGRPHARRGSGSQFPGRGGGCPGGEDPDGGGRIRCQRDHCGRWCLCQQTPARADAGGEQTSRPHSPALPLHR